MRCGNYFKFNLAWCELRDDPRILFVRYEDILKKPEESIHKIATFMGKTLNEETVKKIKERISFQVGLIQVVYNKSNNT